jgi:thioredoxin 1
MGYNPKFNENTSSLAQIEALTGNTILEFGTPWCEICQAAKPIIQKVLTEQVRLEHIKIYDGKGKQLGRDFKVKLWPTLIALHNGKEIARLVRPTTTEELHQLINKFS